MDGLSFGAEIDAPQELVQVKVWFYIALHPVRWTAQSALHFPPLADLFIPTPFSASLGSILAMQQLRNDYSLTFPPLSIARYSRTCLGRPPLLPSESGRSRQVVSHNRSYKNHVLLLVRVVYIVTHPGSRPN